LRGSQKWIHFIPSLIIYYFRQLGDTKKPPEVLEKIISGRLRKFYEEVCLTEQEHMVEEGGPKVGKALEALGLEIRRFEAVYI
jgi:translation elongation factor EF-Ts